MAAGGAATGVPATASREEVARQLLAAGASVLVCAPELAGTARSAADDAGVREVVALGEAAAATPLAALLGHGAAATVATAPGAVALLPFSSGTTGLPKPVMLTHANLVTAARQTGSVLRLSPSDVLLAAAPFAHVTGFSVVLAAGLAAGATVVTMDRFAPGPFAELLERRRVSVLVGAPPMMAVLAGHPALDGRDLSALRLIASGGAPLGEACRARVAARFPRAVVGQGYGLTETTGGVAFPDGVTGTVPGSAGRVGPSTEVIAGDPVTGASLGPGAEGELHVRGPQVMAGYRDRPDATAAAFAPGGWLRTGDLGRVDADGNVFVVDRLKELIKVDALQVAPAELEALLAEHPAVADAAVVPRADARHGQVPVAFVVPAGPLDDDALLAWAAARVAPYKRPRAVHRVDAIPRTPGGKILRRELAVRLAG